MARFSNGWLDRFSNRRTLKHWRRARGALSDIDAEDLRKMRGQAKALQTQLGSFVSEADAHIAQQASGISRFPRPAGSDWAWRPALWRAALPFAGIAAAESRTQLGDEATLFHDCAASEITLRQVRNHRETDLALYGLRMDVFRFDGSFLSLVVDLPPEAVADLTKSHILRMDCSIDVETPLEIFARLNIKNGPNTEQIVREVPIGADEITTEFDMAYTNINEKRLEKAWMDIIFEGPEMNQVILRDVTFSRRPRAQM